MKDGELKLSINGFHSIDSDNEKFSGENEIWTSQEFDKSPEKSMRMLIYCFKRFLILNFSMKE